MSVDDIEEVGEEAVEDEAEAGPAAEEEEQDAAEEGLDDDADSWPRLQCEPCTERVPLELGPRPRHAPGSQYPPEGTLPASLNQFLRSYQKAGVEWMWGQYVRGVGGILGDEMGLGKTVQVACFLSAVLGKTATAADRERPFPLPERDCRQALVVVPTSTLSNWEHELTTWGCFRVRRFHGSTREAALEAAKERYAEVLLTTHATANLNVSELAAIPWEVVVFDEVHLLKNETSQQHKNLCKIRCPCKIGLTGTPMSNDYMELWSLFSFVSGYKVGEKKAFKQEYAEVLKAGQRRSARQAELNRRARASAGLRRLIDAWMLQRFKTIIADQLPRKDDNIVFCALAPKQREVYRRIVDSPDVQLLVRADDECWCGSGLPTKECHPFDPDGVLCRFKHPDNEACPNCPNCIAFPAMNQLQKAANHLELLKPDQAHMKVEQLEKQTAFARMALGLPDGADVARNTAFLSQSSSTHCGKMKCLEKLLRLWKSRKQKVPSPPPPSHPPPPPPPPPPHHHPPLHRSRRRRRLRCGRVSATRSTQRHLRMPAICAPRNRCARTRRRSSSSLTRRRCSTSSPTLWRGWATRTTASTALPPRRSAPSS